MQIDKTQREIFSQKIAKVLGQTKMQPKYSKRQATQLNQAMHRLLKRHQGQADQVTEAEIQGMYEIVMEQVLPYDLSQSLAK